MLHIAGDLDKLLPVLRAYFELIHDGCIMSDLHMVGNLVLGLLLLGSLTVWGSVTRRWLMAQPIIEWRPRDPAPWSRLAVGLALPVSIVVQGIVLSTARQQDLSPFELLQAQCLAISLEILVVMGLLAVGTPIRAVDFGLEPARLMSETRIGLAGFLASLVPVYAVNTAVELLGWRAAGAKHSFLQILEKNPGAETVGWIVLGAVVLAPLAEELIYRVILQGWLETRLTPRSAILFVAFLFAAVHFEPGRPDSLPLFPLALILGFVYHRRHSYATVAILHAAFNATNLGLTILYARGGAALSP